MSQSQPYIKTTETGKVKASYQKRVVRMEDGKFMVMVTELKKILEPLERKWVDVRPNRVFYEPLETYVPNLSKTAIVNVLIMKSGLDQESMENISALFIQKITCTIPPQFVADYLVQTEGRLYINDLNSGICREINLVELFGKGQLKVRSSKPMRISKADALKKLKNKEVYPYILRKMGNDYVLQI